MARENVDKRERVEEREMDVNRVMSITLSGQSLSETRSGTISKSMDGTMQG